MNKFILTLAFLLSYPVITAAQQRNAFVDPTTGVLKAVGYVETNAAGEIKIPVANDFNLKPSDWRFDGNSKSWVAAPSTAVSINGDLNDLAFAIDNAVSSPVPAEVKAVLLQLKKVLGNM